MIIPVANVKNVWSCTFTLLYVFMEWYLIKFRDNNFTFTIIILIFVVVILVTVVVFLFIVYWFNYVCFNIFFFLK
jgi:hypothetical protein